MRAREHSALKLNKTFLLTRTHNMLDEAFAALKQYDWGTDRAPLVPIDEAVAAAHGNADADQKPGRRGCSPR